MATFPEPLPLPQLISNGLRDGFFNILPMELIAPRWMNWVLKGILVFNLIPGLIKS